MSFGLTEPSCQKGLDEIPSHRRPNGSATHAEDVHVIILDPLPGREMIVDQRSADCFALDRGPSGWQVSLSITSAPWSASTGIRSGQAQHAPDLVKRL
jgi:hypothetical protein